MWQHTSVIQLVIVALSQLTEVATHQTLIPVLLQPKRVTVSKCDSCFLLQVGVYFTCMQAARYMCPAPHQSAHVTFVPLHGAQVFKRKNRIRWLCLCAFMCSYIHSPMHISIHPCILHLLSHACIYQTATLCDNAAQVLRWAVSQCLQSDPKARPTAAELVKARLCMTSRCL